jgi:hypothetical protein
MICKYIIDVYWVLYPPADAARPAGHINLTIKYLSNINDISKLTKTYDIIN